jgi:hypothetical protein
VNVDGIGSDAGKGALALAVIVGAVWPARALSPAAERFLEAARQCSGKRTE